MKSIRRRLLTMLFAFIILPYFVSVLMIYSYTKDRVERHEYRNAESQLQDGVEDVSQYLEDLVQMPFILNLNRDLYRVFENGFENEFYSNQLEVDKSFQAFSMMRSEIRQVRFYIAKGSDTFSVVNGKVSTRKRLPGILEDGSVQRLLQSDSHFAIEPPHTITNYSGFAALPASDRTKVLTIHHKIVDALTDEFLGLVTYDIDLNVLSRICNRYQSGDEESVLLTNEDGMILYATDTSRIGITAPNGTITSSDKGQSDDIVIRKPLPEPFAGWHLTKATSSGALYRSVRQTAYTNVFVGAGVVFLGLVMISLISFKITRPIKLLIRKVRRIEGGSMDVRFNQDGQDEIGHLERHIKEMMERINRHIDREYRLELENKTNQYRALQSQINPHFLYNALQSIGAVALRSQTPQVYELVTSLSKMMRYTLRMGQWTTTRGELDYVNAYLDLQKERFRTELRCTISIDESIMDLPVPTMILQPLVENYFKHCFEEGHYDSTLSIQGSVMEGYVVLLVENDGPDLTREELQELRRSIYADHKSGTESYERIGLKNIHDRLTLYYGPSAGLQVESVNGRFTVILTLPIKPKEEMSQDEGSARG